MKKFFALLLVFFTALTVFPLSAFSDEPSGVITISTVADWNRLARKCTLDSYSEGKTVVLSDDLDFAGSELTPIPLFSGTFRGEGHTIRNFYLLQNLSIGGLFRRVQKNGQVLDLHVSGILRPGGTSETIGGIAGINEGQIAGCSFIGAINATREAGGIAGENAESGEIRNCVMKGSLSAQHKAGGIAGENAGAISGCINRGEVGTVAIEDVRPESLDLSLTAEELIDITDVGGIAGFSSGLIQNCTNEGKVGYRRIGYNIGGIAGRLTGMIHASENKGEVFGRKDTGGIAGQLDPDTSWDFSESNLAKLNGMLGGLKVRINALIGDAQNLEDGISANAEKLLQSVSDLGTNTTLFTDQLKNWVREATAKWKDADGNTHLDLNIQRQIEATANPQAILEELQKLENADDLLARLDETIDLDVLLNVPTDFHADAPSLLFQNLQGILAALSDLRKVFADTPFLDDIQALSDQVFSISDFVAGMFRKSAPKSTHDYIRDISDHLEEKTCGIIDACSNSADVEAETNAGGIVGAISIDISFDREDGLDLSALLSGGAKYLIFACIQDCTSYADVHAFKEAAGGIAGRMDYGAATGCKASGSIRAAEDYAGGIAGLSGGSLQSCYARVNLSAERFQGGIAGKAYSLYQCFSLPYFESKSEYQGGIAGSADGELSGNYYTKVKAGAIDGCSFKGKAQRLSYRKFLKKCPEPTLFRTVTLTFVFEDGTTWEVSQPFGEPAREIPSVPDKDGKRWKWNPFRKKAIYHSMTIEGSYVSPLKTLATEEETPRFLIEGEFYEGQSFTVSPFSGETGLHMRGKDTLTAWSLQVADYNKPVTVRMRSEIDGTIYVRESAATFTDSPSQNGSDTFAEVPSKRDGSYLVFTAPANSDFALLSRPDNTKLIIIMAVLLVLILILSIHIHMLRKRLR